MEEQTQYPIVLVRLNNGLELIGKITDQDEVSFKITDPFQVGYRLNEASMMPVVNMIRFMMLSEDDTVELPNSEVLTTAVPRKSIVEYYHKACDVYKKEFSANIDSEARSSIGSLSEMYETLLKHFPANRETMQ